MVIVALVSIPAIAVNPYGVQMLGYPFRTVGIGVLQDFIQEWASPNFHSDQHMAVCAAAAGRAGSRWAEQPPDRLDRSDPGGGTAFHGADGRAQYRRVCDCGDPGACHIISMSG